MSCPVRHFHRSYSSTCCCAVTCALVAPFDAACLTFCCFRCAHWSAQAQKWRHSRAAVAEVAVQDGRWLAVQPSKSTRHCRHASLDDGNYALHSDLESTRHGRLHSSANCHCWMARELSMAQSSMIPCECCPTKACCRWAKHSS